MSGFADRLVLAGVRPPVRVCPDEAGVIEDADGRDFATIDVNAERTDEETLAIARLVAEAINALCPAQDEIPEGGCGTAREAPTASELVDALSSLSEVPHEKPAPVLPTDGGPVPRPASQRRPGPMLDLRSAPSSMEQRAAGWRKR